MTKLFIAVPSLDMCPVAHAAALAAACCLTIYDKRLRREVGLPTIAHQQGSNYALARNFLAQQAMDMGATHLLFIDSDMTFPPDTFSRLVSHHVPVVGANYIRRQEGGELMGLPLKANPPKRDGLTAMFHLPLGLMLLDLKVFGELQPPWFSYAASGKVSEDTQFCADLRDHGYTIWCDDALTQQVGHVGMKVYRP